MRFGYREIIFLIVLLSVPVASFWFVFKPQNGEIMQAREEIHHKEQMLRKLSEVTAQTSDIAALNDEIGSAFDPFDLICHVAFDQPALTRRDHLEPRGRTPVELSEPGEPDELDKLIDYANQMRAHRQTRQIERSDPGLSLF